MLQSVSVNRYLRTPPKKTNISTSFLPGHRHPWAHRAVAGSARVAWWSRTRQGPRRTLASCWGFHCATAAVVRHTASLQGPGARPIDPSACCPLSWTQAAFSPRLGRRRRQPGIPTFDAVRFADVARPSRLD